MTDSVEVLSHPAVEPQTGRIQLLRRIAGALDMPVSEFYGPAQSGEHAPPTKAECDALLAAFERITDVDARRRCLALIRTYAER
ncbi:hypothetical protein [Methylobacterium sp. A54F]